MPYSNPIFLAFTTMLLSGCLQFPVANLNDENELPISDMAVVSTSGIDIESGTQLDIVSIDGIILKRMPFDEPGPPIGIRIPPGTHTFVTELRTSLQPCFTPYGFTACSKTRKFELQKEIFAGNVYAPKIQINNNEYSAYIEEKGVGYPLNCLGKDINFFNLFGRKHIKNCPP